MNKMNFIKLGALWTAGKKDRFGKPYMSGNVEVDITLHKGDKLFVFQNQKRNLPTSPVANVSIGQVEKEPEPEPIIEDQGPAPWDEPTDVQVDDKGPVVPDDVPF